MTTNETTAAAELSQRINAGETFRQMYDADVTANLFRDRALLAKAYTDLTRELAEARAECERAKQASIEWHRTVVECERIVGAVGTAESGLTSNLPNLVRDAVVERDQLKAQAAAQPAPSDTLAAAAEEAVLTLRSAAATIFSDDYEIFLRECEQSADRLAAAIEKRRNP